MTDNISFALELELQIKWVNIADSELKSVQWSHIGFQNTDVFHLACIHVNSEYFQDIIVLVFIFLTL